MASWGKQRHTNRLLHQLRGDSGVDASRHGTDDLRRLADQVSYPGDLLLDEVLHDPVVVGAADVNGEVAEDFGSAGCLREKGEYWCKEMYGSRDWQKCLRARVPGGIGRLGGQFI